MALEYESIPPEVQASDLHLGEPVCLIQRGRRKEGIVEGIQLALPPYGHDMVIVRLDAGGRILAIPEQLEWVKGNHNRSA